MDINKFIVDRVEKNIVILETEESIIEIDISLIKGKFKEGDILVKKDEFYEVDHEKTNLRKEKINHIMKGIWEE